MGNWPIHTFTQWADFQEGQVLLIDKPLEWTSFDVVNKVRHLIRRGGGFKKIKVGHAGTLDPLATGVLVLCTGRMTKRIAELSAEDKAYQGHMTFGSTTESLDLESTPIPGGSTEALDLANLREAAVEFTGAIEQLPPIFSAKKVGGAGPIARRAKEKTSHFRRFPSTSTVSMSPIGQTPSCPLTSCAPRAPTSGRSLGTWVNPQGLEPTCLPSAAQPVGISRCLNAGASTLLKPG